MNKQFINLNRMNSKKIEWYPRNTNIKVKEMTKTIWDLKTKFNKMIEMMNRNQVE